MNGRWRGVLLRGPSGCAKSDLAIRAVQAGWRLVADDRVVAWRSGERVFGRAPAVLRGLLEARGQAILQVAPRALASIDLVVDLIGPDAALERLPEPGRIDLFGAALPQFALGGGEASSLARLTFALQTNDFPAAKAPL